MDTSRITQVFEGAEKDIRINTAYPIEPSWFAPYRTRVDLFQNVHTLSYYLHIPFCKTLCKYCEYARFLAGDIDAESHYVDLLEKQSEKFLASHRIDLIRGFDIGGGTPTAISIETLRRVLSIYRSLIEGVRLDSRFVSSIEFSFDTISEDKIAAIAGAGFSRVSSGVQAVGKWFEDAYGRPWNGVNWMRHVHGLLHDAGIRNLNLDLMYGFPGQGNQAVSDVVSVISSVMPEQVTLYEMRYGQNAVVATGVTREKNYSLYSQLYERLTLLGYKGRFGANAFSLDGEIPLSSYIASRMEDSVPYKGLGVAAQSMSDVGLSYNTLKGASGLQMPTINEIGERDIYLLPGEELAAKYISIALYGGQMNMQTVSRLLGEDGELHFSRELEYLNDRGLIRKSSCLYRLSEVGVRYAGAVGALFWPKEHLGRFVRGREFGC